MGISHTTLRLATLSLKTHRQRTQQGQNRPRILQSVYLNDTFAKLFEGLLIARLTTHTELFNTLTYNQLGTKPDTQTHNAIYSLLAIIQHNKYTLQKPTYVAFVDYSTAYPSVHRDGLSSNLLKDDIRGNKWYHFRARFDKIKLPVTSPPWHLRTPHSQHPQRTTRRESSQTNPIR